MRIQRTLFVALIPGLFGCSAEEHADISMLFVQSATGVECDGSTLTLTDVHASTVGFSDRPERIVWREPTSAFVDSWTAGSDSFADDPPNATLSIFDEEDVRVAVLILSNPRLEEDRLTYDIDVTAGSLPESGGPCSLFIDSYQLFSQRTGPTQNTARDDRVDDRHRDIRQDRVGTVTPPSPRDSVNDVRQDRVDHRSPSTRKDDRVDR